MLPDSGLARWLFLAVLATVFAYWKVPILRHPRYAVRLLMLALLISVVLVFIDLGWLSTAQPLPLIAVIILLVSYSVLLFFAPRAPLLWSKVYLERLGRLVDQGWSWNDENLCSKKPVVYVGFCGDLPF